jgi:hypothetical protein
VDDPLILALLLACTWRMRLESHPPGAEVRLPDNRVVSTPSIVKIHYSFFRKAPIVVSAPGYRTLSFDLMKRKGNGFAEINVWRVASYPIFHPFAGFRKDPRRRLEIVLVPEHGPAGTWDPSQVPKQGE